MKKKLTPSTDKPLPLVPPTKPTDDLSDQELDKVAGGAMNAFIWFERKAGQQVKVEDPNQFHGR